MYQEKEKTRFVQGLKWENRLADEKTKALKYWKLYQLKAIQRRMLGPDLPYKYAGEGTGVLSR